MKSMTLNNGVKIPRLGFGTWCIDDARAAEAVRTAVEVGYRHIDTAQAYGNERGVGEGVRTCGVKREELFVVSKVAAEHKSYEAAARSIDETLKTMRLDYLDLMMIHAPQPWAEWRGEKRYFEENREVWRALEDAYAAGKLRAIGVSNFLRDDLESLLPHTKVKPAVNQVLAHIGNTPAELIAFCRENDIAVEAYSPIAHGEALKSPVIAEMAGRYGVSPAQLCIRYILQLGLIALPKASSRAHIAENAALDFDISEADMTTLCRLEFKDYGEYSYFPVFSGK
ncbi:MAG TPA: 2,5-diketo-D-gluconic acid reductase [Clostridiales bacterium]|nr:2,5-diketo-D-gluconic acid reductase [Clostridiales bacterium]